MTFSISAKIKDGGRNLEKSNFFKGPAGVVLSSLGVQNLPEITQSLTVQDKQNFPFLPTFNKAPEILMILNFSQSIKEQSLVTRGTKICLKLFVAK